MPENKKAEELQIAFIEPPNPDDRSIPEQEEHFRLPARFGAVPVDEAPLGWETETRRREVKVTKFQHVYPTIRLPFQEVQRVEFGHNDQFLAENKQNPKLRDLFPTGANRLLFGDNLHVMRQLPSESIDLIYIDPPFFSGRNYNVIFGDKNEVRSFSDIWEGGMPGYLVWLNARLWEMKRLLKPTGSIYVHLDWHASHYVKVEMDKIFGYDNFRNEIVWEYRKFGRSGSYFPRSHDTILFYAKGDMNTFNPLFVPPSASTLRRWGTKKRGGKDPFNRYATEEESSGAIMPDHWDIGLTIGANPERIGYPTQKPLELMQRIVEASSKRGDVVADFFCGGGSLLAAAQGHRVQREKKIVQKRDGTEEEIEELVYFSTQEQRRWIACDQSRIAVAITADRVAKVVEEKIGKLFPVPDFTVEHWGIYEAPKLEQYTVQRFREFVVKAFGGKPESVSRAIHGMRYGIPLYVGEPSRKSRITKDDVAQFAKAVYEERRANHGVILGWNFAPDARKAAEILAARENKRIDFVRLSLIRLEDDEFREHIVNKNRDYGPLLRFIQPPEVRVTHRRLRALFYEFDVSESVSLNSDGAIANVQWDFDHKAGRFASTQGYSFLREKKTRRPVLTIEFEFPMHGEYTVACSVQDDQGGERTVVMTIEVT